MRREIRCSKGWRRRHEARKGLWADPHSVPPWEWRKPKPVRKIHGAEAIGNRRIQGSFDGFVCSVVFGRQRRSRRLSVFPNHSILDWLSGIQNDRGVCQVASEVSAVETCRSRDHPVSRRPSQIMKSPVFIKIFEQCNLKSDRGKDGFQRSVCVQNMMII